MLDAYRNHVAERAAQNVPPLPLNAQQTADLVELLKNPPTDEEDTLVELLTHRVPPGVDQAAYVKAAFLSAVAKGEAQSPLIDRAHAVKLLGTMLGGYNIQSLIDLLDDAELAPLAVKALSHTLLLFDAYHDVIEKAEKNPFAKQVVDAWANAEWFTSRPQLAEKSPSPCSRYPGKPTPMIYPRPVKPGAAPIFPCMLKRCCNPRCPMHWILSRR